MLRTKLIVLFSIGATLVLGSFAAADSDVVGFDNLFYEYALRNPELSPDGNYVAFQTDDELHGGNPEDGYRVLHRLQPGSELGRWNWIDDTTLFVQIHRQSGETVYRAIRLRLEAETGKISLRRKTHRLDGYIDDFLPDEDSRVLFARYPKGEIGRSVELYKMDVFEKTSEAYRRGNRVKIDKSGLRAYIHDQAGSIRSGYEFNSKKSEMEFWRPDDTGKWTVHWTYEQNVVFRPIVTSDNGETLLVVTDLFSPKRALVELRTEDGGLIRILESSETRHVAWAQVGSDGYTPQDVQFTGKPVSEIKPLDARLKSGLASLDLGDDPRHIALLDYSRNMDILLVRTVRPEHPGKIHRCFVASKRCEEIGSVAPWLDAADEPIIEQFAQPTGEDLQFQPTLIRPAHSAGRMPLIVMPYDLRAQNYHPDLYDDGVSALLRNGFAVLQLAYIERSAVSHEDLGSSLQEYSRRIQRQLDASFDAHPLIDRDRVCFWATGIDAFVTLDFAIRNPDSARCVTASEPVTDLTVLTSESPLRSRSSFRRGIANLLPLEGLSEKDLAAASIAYRHAGLDASVYLSHDGSTESAEPEHMWRLFQLLRLRGVPMELEELDEDALEQSPRDQKILNFTPFLEFLIERTGGAADDYTAQR